MNASQFLAFRSLAHELAGVTIADTKRQMLASRLGRRMKALQIASFSCYYKRVMQDELEQLAFVDQVTTHETRFFRTPHVWDHLRQEFLPQWYAEHVGMPCKVWSAASASGEEAYSLAILLSEFARSTTDFEYSIYGTDVSQRMIDHCERAVYRERSVTQFATSMPAQFRRYIELNDGAYRVREAAKEYVSFSRQNLFSTSPAPLSFDLVLLRNVLIYFSPVDQRKVLRRLHRAMRPGATLIIGESEVLSGLDHLFTNTHPLIYRVVNANV